MEAHAGGRILVTVVTIGQVDGLRSRTVQEVLQGVIAVVTGTITHIRVVSQLIFVAGARSNLVVASKVGHVILDQENAVVDSVLPGEEFITHGHVRSDRARAIKDVNEGERLGIGSTDVVQNGVGGEELVGEHVGQTAVEVEGPGVDHVLHGVHGVGKSHGVLGQTVLGSTLTAV